MSRWQELEAKYFMQTVKRVPLTIVAGNGSRVWDENGQVYLDFVAGWAVDSLGHCHPAVADAITEQAHTLIQTSNQFYTIPQIQLADILVRNSCLDKIFFCNSGTEANEGAVKLARRYGKLKLNGAYEVVTAFNSFHGRTLAMTAATGQTKFQDPYQPLPVGFKNVEYNNIEAIKEITTEQTCAVMLEPIEAEGGVYVPDDAYLPAVRDWCNQKGILLILDEIQTGIGRTGTLFAYQQAGIEPDIMTLAKGLGSGVPIGAFLAKDGASVFVPGDHGGTFGGNPLTCAAAYETVRYILERDIVKDVREVGEHFINGLRNLKQKYDFITDVRGRGLLIAIEFNSDIAQEVLMTCLERGLLVNALKPNALRFMPPLIVGVDEINEALSILDGALVST